MQTSSRIEILTKLREAAIVIAAMSLLSSCSVIKRDRKVDALVPQETSAKSMAALRLEDLQEQEKLLFLELTITPEKFDQHERQRRLMKVVRGYESFLSQNPEYPLGYVFYGKFLRRLDERKKANRMFMKANDLDSNMASVKQQIGNYLAEEGAFEFALPYFLAAVELSPDTAIYHYQLGELLYTFKDAYLSEKIYTSETLGLQMQEAFKQAARLDPASRDFKYRYAESFYDVQNPDWKIALGLWSELKESAVDPIQIDITRLHLARVFIELDDVDSARSFLSEVEHRTLEKTRQELLTRIN